MDRQTQRASFVYVGELGVDEHTSSNLCSYLEQVMRSVLMER